MKLPSRRALRGLLPWALMLYGPSQLVPLLRQLLSALLWRLCVRVNVLRASQPELYGWIVDDLRRRSAQFDVQAKLAWEEPVHRAEIQYAALRSSQLVWLGWLPVWCQIGIGQSSGALVDLVALPNSPPTLYVQATTCALGPIGRRRLHAWMAALQRAAAQGRRLVTVYKRDSTSRYMPTVVGGSVDFRERQAALSRIVFPPYAQLPEPAEPVLPDGAVAALLDDARRFLASADLYRQRGTPYRRGYLLYGPPGTGKTSLLRYLAAQLGLDLAVVPTLSGDSIDGALAPYRAILVFEDLDKMIKAASAISTLSVAYGPLAPTSSEEAAQRGELAKLAQLIQELDGVCADEGRIYVATCNDPSLLDAALLRAGRFDYKLELTYANDDQIGKLLHKFYPDAGGDELAALLAAIRATQLPISPAQLQAWLQRAPREQLAEGVGAYLQQEQRVQTPKRSPQRVAVDSSDPRALGRALPRPSQARDMSGASDALLDMFSGPPHAAVDLSDLGTSDDLLNKTG